MKCPLSSQSRAPWAGQVWNSTAMAPQRNRIFACIYRVLKQKDKIPSYKQSQLDLEGEGMVFRDALAAGLAASGDLFPAPELCSFWGAQLVRLGLGDLCAKESVRVPAVGTYGLRNAD